MKKFYSEVTLLNQSFILDQDKSIKEVIKNFSKFEFKIISFDLIEGGQSTLIIYNLLGKKINTLMNSSLNPGHHNIEWNGLDDNGQPVASGVYFYELRSGDFTAKKKNT